MAPGDSLLVGEVHRDADGAWVIGLARPIVKEGGGATEAIVATIDLAPFSAFMRELNSDPLAILALTRRDGRPIALFTSRGEVIGGRDIAARLGAAEGVSAGA